MAGKFLFNGFSYVRRIAANFFLIIVALDNNFCNSWTDSPNFYLILCFVAGRNSFKQTMERNEEEARRAMGIAEKRLLENDYHGAKTFVNQERKRS